MRTAIYLLGSWVLLGGLTSLTVSGCDTSQTGRGPEDAAIASGGAGGITAATTGMGGGTTVSGGTTAGAGGGAGRSAGGTSASAGITVVAGQSATAGRASSSIGGTTSAGGSTAKASTGGTVATGGSGLAGKTVTGGSSVGTGGTVTGGRSSTGGVAGTGGTATGGNSGTGGVAGSGGAGTGGSLSTGGSVARVCPDSGSYVGSSTWPDKMVVTTGATYCGHFKESRDLEKEYATKAKLTIAPGTYALPSTAGTHSFALPVCFERRAGQPIPTFAGAGQAKATPYKSTVNTFASNGVGATQPIDLDGSTSWIFSMALSYFSWTGTPQPPVLDGSYLNHPSTGEVGDTRPGYLNTLELCQSTTCEDTWQDLRFEACAPDYPLYRHTIAFTGGQIVLDLRFTGSVGAAVMLAAFTAATGTLDSKGFTQNDYWKLIYSADHHHFTRNFAVLFDAPIGDACGLKVTNFWGSRFEAPLPDVSTIRCDLTTIAARTVSSATVERP